MVPCFFQACGSLLEGYSSWDERSALPDKEKGLFCFFLQRSALCSSYFCPFFYPRDGTRQSIGCFHGRISERALQKLKRWVVMKSSSCQSDFEATPGPARDLSLDHQRREGRAVPRDGEQRKKSLFCLLTLLWLLGKSRLDSLLCCPENFGQRYLLLEEYHGFYRG